MKATAEAGQRTVRTDHTVTWENQRYRVLTVRGANRTSRAGAEAEPARLFAVADGLAVGDRREGEPAAALEVGAVEVEQQVELGQLAGEVRLELRGDVVEDRAAPIGLDVCRRPPHPIEATIGAEESERADRSR